MVDKGKKLHVEDVGGWYHCGKVDTLLETNEHLLKHGRGQKPGKLDSGVRIREPVRIEEGVTLKSSMIGPNVTIEAGSTIEGSTVTNSILGKRVQMKNAKVEGSIIGDTQSIDGKTIKDSVMDAGELMSEL